MKHLQQTETGPFDTELRTLLTEKHRPESVLQDGPAECCLCPSCLSELGPPAAAADPGPADRNQVTGVVIRLHMPQNT